MRHKAVKLPKRMAENQAGELRFHLEGPCCDIFSGGSRVLSPVSVPANSENIGRALSVIAHETGGGGTELEAALRTATQLPRTGFVSVRSSL